MCLCLDICPRRGRYYLRQSLQAEAEKCLACVFFLNKKTANSALEKNWLGIHDIIAKISFH